MAAAICPVCNTYRPIMLDPCPRCTGKQLKTLLARLIWDWLTDTGSTELFGCAVDREEDIESMLSDEFVERWRPTLARTEFLDPEK